MVWTFAKTFKKRLNFLGLAMIFGALITSLLMSFQINLLESLLYDLKVKTKVFFHTPKPMVSLVTIDEDSSIDLDELSPEARLQKLSTAIKNIEAQKPRAIALLMNFNEFLTSEKLGQDNKDSLNAEMENFTKMAVDMNKHGLPFFIGPESDVRDVHGDITLPDTLQKIPHALAVIHRDNIIFSEDKVVRRAIYSIHDRKSLHILLAEKLLNSPLIRPESYNKYLQDVPEINGRFFLINYLSSTQEQAHSFPTMDFKELILQKTPSENLTGKVVLIGFKNENNTKDFVYTPFSKELFTNSKLTVHANILETALRQNFIRSASFWTNCISTFFFTSTVIWIVFNTTPLLGVMLTALNGLIFFFMGMTLFSLFHFSLNMAHPLLGIFFAYYVFVPYRLIMEYKQRSQVQKKNEVLLQVDELKRNFMSLITHDLKTPVARIQGMAETLNRTAANEETVSQILKSTDELNNFIDSILELAKVETKEVKIKKLSKDINRLIESCVDTFQFSAKAKNISMELDLEPQFPISVDPVLTTKIFSNLLDNALKYSPGNTKVIISCKESASHPGFIEISFQDQGAGISSKDQDHLFHKFYRPRNDSSITVKGYGLGLYLSRYFTELHDGHLTFTSKEGQGSVFTVHLPNS